MANPGKRLPSTRSTLNPTELAELRVRFPVPEGYLYRLPTEHETSILNVASGIPIFKASIECGFRFPISDFGIAVLDYYRIAPSQMHPNGWSQVIGFDVLCHLRGVEPSLDLLVAFLRIRESNTTGLYTFQRVYALRFANRLFERPPNKVYDFETQWLVVEVPATLGIPFPSKWGVYLRHTLPSIRELRSRFPTQIDRLRVENPIPFEVLLTPRQLELAGWGTGVVEEVPHVAPPAPVESVSSHEGSVGQDPPSDYGIPSNANDPHGFGSLFTVSDAVLDTNIGPLSDFLNNPSGNYFSLIRLLSSRFADRRSISFFSFFAGMNIIRDSIAPSRTPSVPPESSDHRRQGKRPRVGTPEAEQYVYQGSGSQQHTPPPSGSQLPPLAPTPPRAPGTRGSPRPSPAGGKDLPSIPTGVPASAASHSRGSHSRGSHSRASLSRGSSGGSHSSRRRHVPEVRRDRKYLYTESILPSVVVLPDIIPVSHRPVIVPDSQGVAGENGNRRCFGEDFKCNPGIQDNDTIADPGVAPRLIWSTILPRDEKELFRGSTSASEDAADCAALHAAQQTAVANARNRADRARLNLELNKVRDDYLELLNKHRNYEHLPRRVNELLADNQELKNSAGEKDRRIAELEVVVEQLADLKIEYQRKKDELKSSQQHEATLQGEKEMMSQRIDELGGQNEGLQAEITKLHAQLASLNQVPAQGPHSEAVRAYRLSQDCQVRKQQLAAPYAKYGFYLARGWLESQRPGQSFPELQYTDEVRSFEPPAWSNYEVGRESIEEMLEKAAHDDGSNLTGPWEPRVPYMGPRIEAFDGIDETLGDDNLGPEYAAELERALNASNVPPPPPDHATASTSTVALAGVPPTVAEDAAAADDTVEIE